MTIKEGYDFEKVLENAGKGADFEYIKAVEALIKKGEIIIYNIIASGDECAIVRSEDMSTCLCYHGFIDKAKGPYNRAVPMWPYRSHCNILGEMETKNTIISELKDLGVQVKVKNIKYSDLKTALPKAV